MIPITDISGQSTYNHGQLQGPPAAFIWHHTGMRGTPSDVVNTLNQRGLGVQYIMDRDGSIYQSLPTGARGAHIQNSPDGRFSNNNTVGMEVIANDNKDLTPAQIASGKTFAQEYAQQHPGIQFFGHGQVNPGHKEADEGLTLASQSPGYSGPAVSSQTPTGGTVTGNDNRQAVFNALTSKDIGLTPQQALGVMWSMAGESGGTLSSNALEKATGAGYGLAQWTGVRRDALNAFAQQQGKSINDPNLQIDYLKSELLGSHKAVLDHLKTVTTPDAAARVWTAEYEIPKVNNSEARIAQGSHVGSIDANGQFVAGDAKPGTYASPGTTTATPRTGGGGATPLPSAVPIMTPEQEWGQTLGQAIASIGARGGGGGGMADPPDQPAIRMPALEGFQQQPAEALPSQFQPGAPSLASTLGDLAAQPDPTQASGSLTQGAPSFAQLGNIGTSDAYNYLDPRRTVSPSTTFRGVRLG